MDKWLFHFVFFLMFYQNFAVFPEPSRQFDRNEELLLDKYRLLWTVDQSYITLEIQVKLLICILL